MMKSLWFGILIVGGLFVGVESAQAQFYGGGYGGYYGWGFGGYGYGSGTSMGNFAPPHSIGGYYPVPYSTIFPGYVGNGFNASPFGAGPINYGPYGNGGYGYGGNYRMDGYDAYGRVPVIVPAQPPVTAYRPTTPPQVIHTGAPIKLVCPKTSTAALTYSLNGTVFTIQPGFSQSFRDDRTWKLEFRRAGEGSELVTYTLKPGTFNFGIGQSGWELRQVVNVPTGELPPAPQPTPLPSTTPTPTKSTGPVL